MDKTIFFLLISVFVSFKSLEASDSAVGEYLNNVTIPEYAENSTVKVRDQKAAIPGFFLGLANYGDHRIKQSILDESGRLNPQFSCASASENSCYVVDIFEDRSLFFFEFQSSYNYDPRTPKVESQTISVHLEGSPTLEADDLLDDSRSGTFILFYDCPRKAADFSYHLVEMNIPLGQPGVNLSFSFLKKCGYGTHPYARLVLQNEEGEEMTKETIILDPIVSTFQLTLVMNYAEAVQSFEPPKIAYDHNSYSVRISGQGADRGGTVLGGEKITWVLQDECIGSLNGISRHASIFVSIPPFETLSIHFIKDCGGGRPRGLHVGLTPSVFDIVEDGIVLKSPIRVLNETDKILELHLFLHGDSISRSMLIGPPILDIIDPSIVSGKLISGTGRKNSMALQEILLKAGERKSFAFNFVCKRTGQTNVYISIPVRNRDNIDLLLVKRCKAPLSFRHSTYLTANSTLILLALFAFIFGICIIRKLRPRKS
ncbi:hypothetical protein GAYE_SCF03G2284 [Galdieria yellowstonensis]|uniref:Uncharacterized protein n=1 Tax=Galdieria yellowstonensis TaxID=3028027 RepID=A0AAV9IAL2_9RHOD|nr:hypothetical protein GAYE_SCF03G2284 [Galdieria yellowstonensis]